MPLQASRVRKTFKYAMFFDGIDDYVRVSASTSLTPSADFTVCALVAPADVYANWYGVIDNGRYYVANWWFLAFVGLSGFVAGIGFTDNTFTEFTYPNEKLYTFHQYCFGVSGNTFFGYRDGSLYYTQSFEKTRKVQSLPIDIGRRNSGGSYARFMVSQVLIYSRALTSSEIQWNYLYPDNPVRNGLVLQLRADPQYVKDIDGDGILEWIDLSGYNNHGKIYGATLVQLVKPAIRILPKARLNNILR